MSWTEEELAQKRKDNPDLKVMQENPLPNLASLLEKKNKYHVASKEKRTYNGHVYHSKKEADRARDNDLRIQAGELSFYLTQVPFRLPGGITYRADFAEFTKQTGMLNTPLYEVHFVDVKGYDTPVSALKRKQVKAIYNIYIEVV